MGKLWLIFAAVLAAGIVFVKADDENPQSEKNENIGLLTIEQKLDHFNKTDNRTFEMRYIRNDEFFHPNGPLFIYVGGEYILFEDFPSSHMFDIAKEHKGSLIYTEHRYYGDSKPFDTTNSENMKYLNARQALADLAHLIRQLKITPLFRKSKVILTGCGYSGSLVTWFKKLYPDLVVGGWASSPLLLAKADFSGHDEAIGQSIKRIGGDACYDRIKRGFAELESMFDNKRGSEAKTMLQLCSSFNETNDLEVSEFFYRNKSSFSWHIHEIKERCSKLMKAPSDLMGVVNTILDGVWSRDCGNETNANASSDYEVDTDSFIFWYQKCNEFGWFDTSSSRDQPFGTKYPLNVFITECADAFGDKFTSQYINERIKETNNMFGGLTPNVENVYMTFSEFNPSKFLDKQLVKGSTVIPNASYCTNIDSISDEDSPELRASKEKIAALVRKWLA